jgi:hypothetical protein
VSKSFEYPPEDPFIYYGELDAAEQADVILALSEGCRDKGILIRQLVGSLPPRERREVRHSLSSLNPPRANGLLSNQRVLNPIKNRSILYLSSYADPPAKRTELAEIFGVSQQRISQILGAHKNSAVDRGLLAQFRAATPQELRDQWKVQADLDRLDRYRAGKVAASPLTPRFFQSTTGEQLAEPADPTGRWSAYGYTFAVYERDALFHFLIDAPGEEESEPRNSAKQALEDCAAACREEAWANSSGDFALWRELYREDPLRGMNMKNIIRANA